MHPTDLNAVQALPRLFQAHTPSERLHHQQDFTDRIRKIAADFVTGEHFHSQFPKQEIHRSLLVLESSMLATFAVASASKDQIRFASVMSVAILR
jgi:hypothetical protein